MDTYLNLNPLVDAYRAQVESSENEVRELSERLSARLASRLIAKHPTDHPEIQGMGSMIDTACVRLHERREFLKLLEALKVRAEI